MSEHATLGVHVPSHVNDVFNVYPAHYTFCFSGWSELWGKLLVSYYFKHQVAATIVSQLRKKHPILPLYKHPLRGETMQKLGKQLPMARASWAFIAEAGIHTCRRR